MSGQPTPDDLDRYLDQGRAGRQPANEGLDEATRQVVDRLHRLADQPPLRDDFVASLEQRLLREASQMAAIPPLSPWRRVRARVLRLVGSEGAPREAGRSWSTYTVTGLAALAVVLALFLLLRPLTNRSATLAAPTATPPPPLTPGPLPTGAVSIVGVPGFATPTPLPPGVNVAPLPVPTAWAFEGRLGGPLVTARSSAFAYALHLCSGEVMPVYERTLNELRPFVGQEVRGMAGATGVSMAPWLPDGPTVLQISPAPGVCPPPTPVPSGQPTPLPTGTPFTLTGHVATRVTVPDGGFAYLMTQCDGSDLQLTERTPGQLEPFVGQDVYLILATEWRRPPSLPRIIPAYIPLFVQPGPPCTAPVPAPIPLTQTPDAVNPASTPTLVSPAAEKPLPPPTALPPAIAVGRLGAAQSRPTLGTFYPFERCDRTVYWTVEAQPGLLAPYVGQTVRLYAEPRGIPSNPGDEPQLTVFQVEAVPEGCPAVMPTPTPPSPVAAVYDWLSPDGQWTASVSVGQPSAATTNGGRQPVQLRVRRTDGSVNWTVVDDVERASGWLTPAPQYWTRDGGFLYYAFGFEVHRVDLATGQAQPVALDVARAVRVSPDETKLAYLDWKMRLTVRDLQGQGVQQMEVPGLQDAVHVHDLVWGPDSRAVAFSYPTVDGRQSLIRVNLAPFKLYWQVHRTGPSLTLTGWPQADQMLAKDDQGKAYRVNAETGQVTPMEF